MILKECDKNLINVFGITSFSTISNLPTSKRISFENDDIELLFEEALYLINDLFGTNEFFARISFWDKKDEEKYFLNCILLDKQKDCYIGLFKFKISDIKFKELLKAHLNYEMGLDPYLNITAYFFNFDLKILLNIYDDRGADYIKI